MYIEEVKPKVTVIGQDGNVFNVLGICTRALKKRKRYTKAQELSSRVLKSGSYEEALSIMQEYCDFTGDVDDDENE